MKKFIIFLTALSLFSLAAKAFVLTPVKRITAVVTVTNLPPHGGAIIVNTDTRTAVTNYSGLNTTFSVTNNIGAQTTNLFLCIAHSPFNTLSTSQTSNTVTMLGIFGGPMNVSFLSNWATVSYSTQSVFAWTDVRVPLGMDTNKPLIMGTNGEAYAQSLDYTNLTHFHTNQSVAYVRSTGTNSSGIVGSEAFSFSTIDAALDALPATGGIIDIGEGTFSPITDDLSVGTKLKSNVTFKGARQPVFASDLMSLTNGTIINGGLTISNRNGMQFYNLGIDLGSNVVSALYAGVNTNRDCLAIANVGQVVGRPPNTGIVLQNVTCLQTSPTVAAHACLLENLRNPTVQNVQVCYGTHGIVFKCIGGTASNLKAKGNASNGVIIKSDSYAPCSYLALANVVIESIGSNDTGGLRFVSNDGSIGLNYVSVSGISLTNTSFPLRFDGGSTQAVANIQVSGLTHSANAVSSSSGAVTLSSLQINGLLLSDLQYFPNSGSGTFSGYAGRADNMFNIGLSSDLGFRSQGNLYWGISGLATPRMVLNATGLGIGTTNPLAALAIQTPGTTNGLEFLSSNTDSEILAYSRSGSAYKPLFLRGNNFLFGPSDITKFEVTSAGLGYFTGAGYIGASSNLFSLGGSSDLGIRSIGNLYFALSNSTVPSVSVTGKGVGINTTNPVTTLDLFGTLRSGGWSGPTSGAGVELGYLSSIGVIQAYDRDGSVWKPLDIDGSKIELNLSSHGNVGVDMNPTYKLDVNGTFRASGASYFPGIGTSGFVTLGASGLMVPVANINWSVITNAPASLNPSSIASDLIPSINNAYDLGSLSKYWKHIYAGTQIYSGDTIQAQGQLSGAEVHSASYFDAAGAAGITTMRTNYTRTADNTGMVTNVITVTGGIITLWTVSP